MDQHHSSLERDLADALRRLNGAVVVPPIEPAREAALLAAFDAASARRRHPGRQYWFMAALATAAAVLIAVGVTPALTGRHGPLPAGAAQHGPPTTHRDVQLQPPSDFIPIPGASALPPMESGTLVRVDLPASVLPSYGLTPPPGRTASVTTDLIVGQDGLPRAVRIVN